jgi:hypothetical protein
MNAVALGAADEAANLVHCFRPQPAFRVSAPDGVTIRFTLVIADILVAAFMGVGIALQRQRQRGEAGGIQQHEAEIGSAVIGKTSAHDGREAAAGEALAVEGKLPGRHEFRRRPVMGEIFGGA